MFERYQKLKSYCQTHEWAAGLSALALILFLGTLIYMLLEHQASVLTWLNHSVLINGLLLIISTLVIGFFSMSLFCLSFSSCTIEDRTEKVIHRHKPVLSDGLKIVKNLGVNPKRQRK